MCEQTLFSKESLALPTPGFVLSEDGLVRASDLMLQNSFVFCPFSSSSATALRSRRTLITQSSFSQQQWGVSMKYLALRKATALLWELWAFVRNHSCYPQSSAVSQGTELSLNRESFGSRENRGVKKAFVWKLLQLFFFCYLNVAGSLSCQLRWSQLPWWANRDGFILLWREAAAN